MTTTYQGHHSDGSSIQRHSAGSHYPYVVGKQEGVELPWFVLSPAGATNTFATGTAAFKFAESAARLY
jgi:hypothetical protein